MTPNIIIVTAAFDALDGDWTATSHDLAGLRLTADSWSHLVQRLPAAVRERLRGTSRHHREVSIEVLLHTSLNVTVEASTGHPVAASRGLPSSIHSPDRSC